jgi:hypothetical protein
MKMIAERLAWRRLYRRATRKASNDWRELPHDWTPNPITLPLELQGIDKPAGVNHIDNVHSPRATP